MKRVFVRLAAVVVLSAVMGLAAETLIAHPGNVRRSDCTHVDRKTGQRHKHTGRPYCATSEGFLSPAWMHH